jgi:molybdate transport system regulatory protein
MKAGARNQLVGEVTEIKRGTVMAQVKFTVAGAVQMSSVMTLESLDDLGLAVGDQVKAYVKAVSVLLTKE